MNESSELEDRLRPVMDEIHEYCTGHGVDYTIETDTPMERTFRIGSTRLDIMLAHLDDYLRDKPYVNMTESTDDMGTLISFTINPIAEKPLLDGGTMTDLSEDQYKSPTKAHSLRQDPFRSSYSKRRKHKNTNKMNISERLDARMMELLASTMLPDMEKPTVEPVAMAPQAAATPAMPVPTVIMTIDTGIQNNPDSFVVDILNNLRSAELSSFVQYQLFYIVVPSLHMEGLAEIFKEHMEQEMKHFGKLTNRIHELGGHPVFQLTDIEKRTPFKIEDCKDAMGMVNILAKQEQIAIKEYKSAISKVVKDPVTQLLLTEILADEEEHASDMRSMMEH